MNNGQRVQRRVGWLLLLAWLLAACTWPIFGPATPSPGQVVVERVVDGDTVELADGRTVRYIGINTPERGQPFYAEATAANRRLVEGQAARLELDVGETDRYGRTLAYVWVGEVMVNLELLRQGYANTYTAPPNVRYSEQFAAAEREAREAGRGLWASAGVAVQIVDLNPAEEWIVFQNTGAETVDLAGYTLKDAANHIYTFPSFRLKPGKTVTLYTTAGRDTGTRLYWGLRGETVWNNDHDSAFLRDPEGRLVDSYSY